MKLDFKNDASYLVNEITRLLGLAPLLMMIASVLMLVVSTFAVRDFVANKAQLRQATELPQFEIKVDPVGKRVYDNYAEVLGRLTRNVKVSSSVSGLKIEISDPNSYADFMFVLNSVQGVSKDVVWEAEEICLAGCAGAVSMALIKGVRETVSVKLRG